MNRPLIEGEDFLLEEGRLVFTAKYLLERGYCCNAGCRNCPYRAEGVVERIQISPPKKGSE